MIDESSEVSVQKCIDRVELFVISGCGVAVKKIGSLGSGIGCILSHQFADVFDDVGTFWNVCHGA